MCEGHTQGGAKCRIQAKGAKMPSKDDEIINPNQGGTCQMLNVTCQMPKNSRKKVNRGRRGHQSPKCMGPPLGQMKWEMRGAPAGANENVTYQGKDGVSTNLPLTKDAPVV